MQGRLAAGRVYFPWWVFVGVFEWLVVGCFVVLCLMCCQREYLYWMIRVAPVLRWLGVVGRSVLDIGCVSLEVVVCVPVCFWVKVVCLCVAVQCGALVSVCWVKLGYRWLRHLSLMVVWTLYGRGCFQGRVLCGFGVVLVLLQLFPIVCALGGTEVVGPCPMLLMFIGTMGI